MRVLAYVISLFARLISPRHCRPPFATVRPLIVSRNYRDRAIPMPVQRCCLVLFTVFAASLLCGCSERPFASYGIADPWARKSWKEDEKYGPTYYTKREELKNRRGNLRGLSPEEQERMAVEMADRLRDEQHPVLRCDIIRTLAELPSPTATEALKQATADADPDVRVVACQAWGRRGGGEARQALTHLLGSDTDPDVRMAATRELGRFKLDQEAMQALKIALDENNPAMQNRAIESLKNMSGKDYGTDMVAWRDYIDGGNPAQPPPATIAERLRNLY